MRSNPDIDAKLRARLIQAVQVFAGGNAEAFGKMIGFANGGYIRQCMREDDPRPVRSSLISRVNDHPEMTGWFDQAMPPVVAADVRPRYVVAEPPPGAGGDHAERLRLIQRLDESGLRALDAFLAGLSAAGLASKAVSSPSAPSRKQKRVA